METLKNYMCFQQLVASGATYVCPALARSNGFLPRSAPGEQMLPISGRPFNVIPGKIYVIKKALEPQRAERAFAHLLSTAKAQYEDTLYQELCIDSCDDFGAERPELSAVVKYGASFVRPRGAGRGARRRGRVSEAPSEAHHVIRDLERFRSMRSGEEIVREAWSKEEGHLGRLQKLCDSKVSVADFASLAAVAEGKASLADVDASVQRQVQRRLQCLISDQRLVSHAEERSRVGSITEATTKEVKERLKEPWPQAEDETAIAACERQGLSKASRHSPRRRAVKHN
eukprot:g4279.t1